MLGEIMCAVEYITKRQGANTSSRSRKGMSAAVGGQETGVLI